MSKMFKRAVTFLLTCALVAVSFNGIITLETFAASGNTDYVDYGGTVYYIDSVNGNDNYNGTSESTPWKTLNKVNAQVYNPGDQILFKSGGVWNGRLIPQGSGAEGAPITIGKYGGDAKPILNGSSNMIDGFGEGSTVYIHNVEYYEIYDLEVTNKTSGQQDCGYGIWVSVADMGSADHYVVKNCYVHDVVGNASPSVWKTAINNGGEIDGIELTKGAIQFETSCGPAMIPTYFNGVDISNNTVTDCDERTGINISSAWTSEVYTGSADDDIETAFSINIRIANNILYDIAAGITVFTVDGSVGDGVVVENNVSYGNNRGNSFWVFWSSDTIDLIYQNNEVYDQFRTTGSDDGVFDADGQSVGTVFQYNYTHHNCGPAYVFCEAEYTTGIEPSYVKATTFRYNISYNDNWRFYRERGTLFNNKSENGYFYNNLMYADGYDTMFFDMDMEDVYLYNNIFYHTGRGNSYLNDYKANKEAGHAKLKVNEIVEKQILELSDTTNGDKLNAIINWGLDVEDKQMLYLRNNCFYNVSIPMPQSAETIIVENNIFDDPMLNLEGIEGNDIDENSNLPLGVYGIETVRNNELFTLKDGSPCIGAGILMSNNGGRDFYGNLVSNKAVPDIGPHQKTNVGSVASSITLETPSADDISTETVVLNWDEPSCDVDFNKYVVYVNGKAHDTISSNQRKTKDYIHRYYKGNVEIINEKNITLYDLNPDTNYEIYIVGFSGDGNTIKGNIINITTDSLAAGENQLKVDDFKIYTYDVFNYNPVEASSFNINDIVYVELYVKDAVGRAVKGALVKVLFEAVDMEFEKFDVSLTDKNGRAKVGIRVPHLPSEQYEIEITPYSVTKNNYTFAGAPSKRVTAAGFSAEYNGNLLENSDFSNVTANGLPTTWRLINSNSMKLIENEGPDGDENIIDIRSSNFTSSQISQRLNGIPNGTYTLTAWVRSNNSASTFGVSNNGNPVQLSVPMNEEWNRIIISDVAVSYNIINVYLTVPQFADYSVYTQICNIELTRNMMYDTEINKLKDSQSLTLPRSFYYSTADGVKVDVGDVNLAPEVENNESLKAVNVSFFRGSNYRNGIYINSDKAFDFQMGQFKKNLEAGNYTFSASTMSTGGINGYLRIRDGVSGAVLASSAIQASERYEITQTTANITSGSAYVELVFKGEGDPTKFIDILELSFANRSDLPSSGIMAVIPGQNLMENLNGDFEQDGKPSNSIPTGWYLNAYRGNFNAYVSDETSVSGNFSMKCTLDEGYYSHNEPTSGGATPLVEFTNLPAGTYTFTFWYRGNFPFTMGVRTNRGVNRYIENVKDMSDTWQKVVIENINVVDGTLNVTNWFNRQNSPELDGMRWVYLDNISLVLNDTDYAVNGDAESIISNTPAGWHVTSSNGFAKLISTEEAVSGDRGAMVALPGSDSAISVSCGSNITTLSGTYSFKAWVRGNGIVTFNIETDKTTEAITLKVDTKKEWEEIIVNDIEVDSVIKSVSFDVVNNAGNTSSFVCVDSISITQTINSTIIAKTLPTVNAVALGENFVLPKPLLDGYTVTLVESSDTSIIALDGTVNIPTSNKFLTLTFKIVNDKNPNDVATASRIVTVYGFE